MKTTLALNGTGRRQCHSSLRHLPLVLHAASFTARSEGREERLTQGWRNRLLGRLVFCVLVFTALLVCRATEVSSAEAKEQRTAAAPESANASSRRSQLTVQEDLGYVIIDGKTKKIVGVHSADAVLVYVIYEGEDGGRGGRKIPRQELPPQLQSKYPYDAAKAEAYRKQQAEAVVQQIAQQTAAAAAARAAAKDAMNKGISPRLDALRRRDVELQKEKSILDSLPKGNGRRVRSQQISNEQESLRQQIAQLEKQSQ